MYLCPTLSNQVDILFQHRFSQPKIFILHSKILYQAYLLINRKLSLAIYTYHMYMRWHVVTSIDIEFQTKYS